MLIILLAALLADVPATSPTAIDMPKEISFYEAVPIRVTGLLPFHPVTLRATMNGDDGSSWTSSARFMPHSDGVVDVSRSIATGGSYEGIDPWGLLWSMVPEGKGGHMPGGATVPVDMKVDVVSEDGTVIASGSVSRRTVPPDVKITELRRPASPIVGRYFEHQDGKKHPAILTITGSNGGIDPRIAPMLASHGYNVLAVAYFHFDGVPDDLIEIPLEYFALSIKWLLNRPMTDGGRVGVVGVSKGSEAALLVAAHYPSMVRGVVAFVPTYVIWEGADARARFGGDPHFDAPGRSSWSLGGNPLPFVHKVVSPTRLASRPTAFLDMYEPALDAPIDPVATIPVERIHGPVFLTGAGDDLAWPSMPMVEEILRRMKAHHFAFPVEHRNYKLAGHVSSEPPGTPSSTFLGGSPEANHRASMDTWERLLPFLERTMRGK